MSSFIDDASSLPSQLMLTQEPVVLTGVSPHQKRAKTESGSVVSLSAFPPPTHAGAPGGLQKSNDGLAGQVATDGSLFSADALSQPAGAESSGAVILESQNVPKASAQKATTEVKFFLPPIGSRMLKRPHSESDAKIPAMLGHLSGKNNKRQREKKQDLNVKEEGLFDMFLAGNESEPDTKDASTKSTNKIQLLTKADPTADEYTIVGFTSYSDGV